MDILLIVILAVIVGAAGWYVYKAKKSGKKCVGCPTAALRLRQKRAILQLPLRSSGLTAACSPWRRTAVRAPSAFFSAGQHRGGARCGFPGMEDCRDPIQAPVSQTYQAFHLWISHRNMSGKVAVSDKYVYSRNRSIWLRFKYSRKKECLMKVHTILRKSLCLLLAILMVTAVALPAAAAEVTFTTLISPKYEDAKIFSDDLAAVKQNGKWGYIDKTGKTVIPFQFDKAYPFSEGLAIVGKIEQRDGYHWTGELDEWGNWVMEDGTGDVYVLVSAGYGQPPHSPEGAPVRMGPGLRRDPAGNAARLRFLQRSGRGEPRSHLLQRLYQPQQILQLLQR